jgi:DNA-binding NarL/FixJ family response regulator
VRDDTITERQRQILALLLQGKSNKEIARDLGITEGTVKVHLHDMYNRMGIRSRAKIVALYNKVTQNERTKQANSTP